MKFDSKPTAVDIFCGAGGLSEGFKQAGFEILLGVDCDPWAVRTFRKHHVNAIQCRVENLTAKRIRKETGGRPVTVLLAGPPCQAFSNVAVPKLRHLKKSTTRSHPLNKLYREVLRLVKDLQPQFFVIENVGRMFSMSDGAIKKEIETELEGKYNISFYYENVADFGVPQFRKRGLAIGNRISVENPDLEHTHYDPEREIPYGRKSYETVRSAISDLPKIKAGGGSEYMDYPNTTALSAYQFERRKGTTGVYNHTARKHSKRDLKIFKMLKPGKWIDDLPKRYNPYRTDIFKDKYKKQNWNRPSSTILAHLSKDGLMFIHPDGRQNRSFTPREAARLQSFNDYYDFDGPRTQQFIQVGNAVPPLFGIAIANGIVNSLTIKVKAAVARRSLHNHR